MIPWTKSWSASDDGTVLGGNDLGTLQADIEAYTINIDGTQTITGNKIYSGTSTFSGTAVMTGTIVATDLAKVSELVFCDGELVSWEDETVYYN
jgi:hypothetical protein